MPDRIGRREFIASTAAAFTVLGSGTRVSSQANGKLALGIIGCGGRGQWIGQLFQEHGNAKIVAVHDYFQDRADAVGEAFGVEPARRYTGLSGYKRLLEGELDAVTIESPPYFHPEQTAAAIDAGKHVFVAKPVAVDVPGCNLILEAGKQAVAKRLCLLVDFQTRNNAIYREAVKRVHEGAIGTPVCGQCFYHAGRLGVKAEPGTPEARLRNWVFDIALSGDIIVEQNIHVIDVATWLLNAHPDRAFGTGGRRARTDVGDCWDHFVVSYEFPDGFPLEFSSSQFAKGFSDLCVRLFGSGGTVETHYGGEVWIKGDQPYEGGNTAPIYQEGAVNNLLDFTRAIAAGEAIDQSADSVRSNLTAILGRTAAYAGKLVTWDEMLRKGERLEGKLKGLKD
jgi:predicted dehydrogenase